MAGVSFSVEVVGLGVATALLARLEEPDTSELAASIGALGESQTRRRISDEKTSPDGAAWPPNLRGGDILVESGQNLLQSCAFTSSADEAEWGAAWEHAHVHQEGATIVPKGAKALVFPLGGRIVRAQKVTIPPRPFVGMSADNAEEHRELATDFLRGLV